MIIVSILLVVSVCINVALLYNSKQAGVPTEDDINDMFIEYQKGISTMLDDAKGVQYE